MAAGYHWWQLGQAVWDAARLFLLNPLLYLATLLLIWDSYKRGRDQRKFFGFRVTDFWRPLLSMALQAIVLGIVVGVVNVLVGITLHPDELWLVTAIVIILGGIRLRYASALYAISVFVLLALLARIGSGVTGIQAFNWVLSTLRGASIVSYIALAAVLAFAEWAFMWLRRNAQGAPALRSSRRGRVIGAVIVQNSAILPVFAFQPGVVPVPAHAPFLWPLAAAQSGLSLVALPMLFGFNGLFSGVHPKHVNRLSQRYFLLMAVLLSADAYLVYRFASLFAVIGIFIILVLKEITWWHLNQIENESDALYPLSSEGVRVMGAARGSVADAMGLRRGEVIQKVNQVPVHSVYDFHFALDQNPAYAKLDVLDVQGEPRIVGKPVFSGERNKLGLVLLPDQPGGTAYEPLRTGWLHTLYLTRTHLPNHSADRFTELDSVSLTD
ncbi:PDZ domain-containing protein [Alicyclobacillus sp. SO9]|uniref:PDZ domain-containing protein n=1 Tax=Alicyclobacillus sp. SO9 TaxID=2665646 RepID=UPI0018E78DB2|nr:PDZ domain-containing protein [Alicyclobacillus sp. SO9]QQE79457.1 PDZ domain-containing protein [Alicyclobacillus sp. SO9]